MERESFKQRMKNLKSYRENNPGRGYWDWKVLAFEDGGEVGDPPVSKTTSDIAYDYEDNLRKIDKVGKRPLEEGLKPAFNLEDFANFTPVGDALSVKDTYDAVRLKDWLGTGLAAVGMLPFVPNLGKKVKGSVNKAFKRETPSVGNYELSITNQLNLNASRAAKEPRVAARLNNETYEVVLRLTDDPSYLRRAKLVLEKYGDDYTSMYADLINAYNENPNILPKAKGRVIEDGTRAKMLATTEATLRHKAGGDFPNMGEYEYEFDIDRGVPYGTTVHELNHQTDFLKNKSPDADGNSNLYYWMRSALKPFSEISEDAAMGKYFGNPTEQKAYMNQLREFMYTNRMITNRDDIVTKEMLLQAMDKLPKGMNSIKDASKAFKSMRSYTKWFNTVPLLGAGAIGVNKYFKDEEAQEPIR